MKQYKATDLITKQAAAEIYCRDCEKKPNDENHCEEVCMGYANIMCIEPAFDKDKVIEQLQRQVEQHHRRAKEAGLAGYAYESSHNYSKACSYECALEIVRGEHE